MEASINCILTNQQIHVDLCDVIWALRSGVALRGNPHDVTQPAPCRPPCGVIQKCSQRYKKNQICLEKSEKTHMCSAFSFLLRIGNTVYE